MSSNNQRSHIRATTDFDGTKSALNFRSSGNRSFDEDDVPAPLLGGKSDFNADFSSQFNNNRNQTRIRDEAKQPMLKNVDANDDSYKRSGTSSLSRSKTTGTTAMKATTGFFGLKTSIASGKSEYDHSQSLQRGEIILEERSKLSSTAPITIGRRKIAVWPYDDYHLVQKMYYEKLQESALEAQHHQQQQATIQYRTKKDMDKATAMVEAAAAQQRDQSIPIFSRPADPPDIPTAVKGLSLTEFEAKAEERAITIVSTWLFDAELIDELLVNGGMTAKMMNHHQIRGLNGDNSNLDGTKSVGDDSTQSGKTTSEGIEVGAHGFPIEGSTKMDKEIAKLRNSTKRQLALINARLNDGVVATGSEVNELVNAVMATRDDISRLKELSSYASNTGDLQKATNFMVNKYPKIQRTLNARRNLGRVFRELDFFASIPGTCERLRDELHAGEWTVHEWSSLRSVTRQHCDLEIFIVEAETEMRKRLLEEYQEKKEPIKVLPRPVGMMGGPSSMLMQTVPNRSLIGQQASSVRFDRGSIVGTWTMEQVMKIIDHFLAEHIKNIQELGEEIRIRILSGISSSFELATNNPAGMVALVEAVEVYELANDEYISVHGEDPQTKDNSSLKFTNMRTFAISELHKDFESRCAEVFNELRAQNVEMTDDPESEEAWNKQFSAILRAAHDLSSEIYMVKERMAPCFPPSWEIPALWTFSVAHVCCENVLRHVGGPEGQRISELSTVQLIDLVAWVETFRETILEVFPNLDTIVHEHTHGGGQVKLLGENSKTIDMQKAENSLSWVSSTLWQVHDLAKDEFLYRTKEQTETWLSKVYDDEHNKAQTSEGRLVTSLCEDVYSIASVQMRTIRQRLTKRSEALVQAISVVLRFLFEKQMQSRDHFCTDFETCCAAANDFTRMSDKCEEIIDETKRECTLQQADELVLDEQAAALLTLYSSDAVFSAKKTHIYCFQPIEEAIANELFSPEWEQELTHNELALTLVRTLDDFMEDLETFLDVFMVTKAVEAQISSSVNFYIRCLLKKSSTHTAKKSVFANNKQAISRMRGDSKVMRDYFQNHAEAYSSLTRIIENEFSVLECIFELISIAAGVSRSDAPDFILILQKRVQNVNHTKLVVGDLWHLVNPNEERTVYDLIDSMEDTLAAVVPSNESGSSQDRNIVPGLRTGEMIAQQVENDNRRRPMAWDLFGKKDNDTAKKKADVTPTSPTPLEPGM